MTSVELLLPCWNEVEALPWVLSRLPAGVQPLVIDNRSSDGSADIARRLGARVVTAEQRGYGAACQTGLLAATADLVAVMDCDGSLDPADLPDVLAPLRSGDADLVVGARRPTSGGAFAWQLRLANRVLARRLSRRTGQLVVDCGPVRAARRETLLGLQLTDRRSGYPAETLVRAADAGLRIRQVDVGYHPRVGRSKVTGTPLGVLRAVRDMSAVLAR